MDSFQLRSRETYKQHCEKLKGPLYNHVATTYGLTRDSILNSSKFFHIVDGLVPDVMHDILEGSLQYEVEELLKYFVNTKNYFTLDELNNKINEFPYVLTNKATNNCPNCASIK